jgi:hypothetical protein
MSFYEGYIDMCFIFLINPLINASFYNCYFMWRSNTFPLTSKGVYKDNYL